MMFQRWGFLMGEIWLLLLLAALLGLLAGWFIWGRRTPEDAGEADRLRAALDACNAKGRDQTARITALEGDLSAAKAATSESAAKAERAMAANAAARLGQAFWFVGGFGGGFFGGVGRSRGGFARIGF